MKHLIRVFLFNIFALWLTSQILPTLKIPSGWQIMTGAGFVLSILMILVSPILKILFIPINLLTFGLLSWFVNVIILYLLTIAVPEIQIIPWIFPGISLVGFIIPPIHLSYIPALVITTFMISAVINILHGISESS